MRQNRSVHREIADIRDEERARGYEDGINACLAALMAMGEIAAARKLRTHFVDDAEQAGAA